MERKIESLQFIVDFKKQLRKKEYPNSTIISIDAANLFKDLIRYSIENNMINTFPDLLGLIRSLGKSFISVDPLQFSIGNIIKRILHIVRDEYDKYSKMKENSLDNENKKKRLMSVTSLSTLIDYPVTKISQTPRGLNLKVSYSSVEEEVDINIDDMVISQNYSSCVSTTNIGIFNEDLREHIENILGSVEELISELESISDVIKDQSYEHINDNDVILTANHSDQLEEFFIEASRVKTFSVIIAESAPTLK
jgi:translation initiation factor eIF-2B subunit beta